MAVDLGTSGIQEQIMRWSENFFKELLSKPFVDSGLRKLLLRIGTSIYHTDFIDDYDHQPDGLSLSELSKYPEPVSNACVEFMYHHGNTAVKQHVFDYVQNYRVRSLAPLLEETVRRCGSSPCSSGFIAQRALDSLVV